MAPAKANLSIASSTRIETRAARPSSADALASLFAPLDHLLREGGDERLSLVAQSGLNVYGCKPAPRSEAICFSSSTASSISGRAYHCARDRQERMAEQSAVDGLLESFDLQIERMRHALRTYLKLEGSEIIFSPSGTDAQLQANLLAGMLLGAEVTTIVVGSDQTGSGTTFTADARHFGARTARGKTVLKGARVFAAGNGADKIEIPFANPDGTFRSRDEMDNMVQQAVTAEIARGRKVLLQTMNASKFGWRAPSDDCVAGIANAWPGEVQIVVDACQMRLSRARIGDYLSRNYLVLFTGSKFFTGPPFSGGLLLPQTVSEKLSNMRGLPGGLADYADRSDLPLGWRSLRNELTLEPNFGQWLRWEAALEEVRAYYALPLSYRMEVLAGLARAIPVAICASSRLENLAPPEERQSQAPIDEEFGSPTIFPFLLRDQGRVLGADAVGEIYRALNRDFTRELAVDASPQDRALAARLCHIGQPVNVTLEDGSSTAALRIAIGSRNLFETWSAGENAARRSIERIMSDIETVLRKINLILRTLESKETGAESMPRRSMETSHGQ